MNLTDLIALNDEIRALVRAGVPLEAGLTAMAQDTPGTLGRRIDELGQRLSAGEELTAVLADPAWGVPPVYQAVVAAGIRAGRLEVALEGIAGSARLQLETRRLATTALLYPIIVLLLAYGVFVLLVARVLPTLLMAHQELLQEPVAALAWITPWSESVAAWAPWPLVAIVACLAYWWWRAGRSTVARGGRRAWCAVSPGRMRELSALATFAEVLALLIEHAVPMPQALTLAADASGGAGMRAMVQDFAQRAARGEIGASAAPTGELPAWLGWLVCTSSPRLPDQLRLTARQYRDEAFFVSRFLTQLVPYLITALGGGLVVASYGLLLFVPMTRLLCSLGTAP